MFKKGEVDTNEAISYCGLDHFGPLSVKVRSNEKRYGVLFTCLNTRPNYI